MNRTVLIVEDSGLTRMEVGDMLREGFNANILEAANGIEGLSQLERRPEINLIICDIEMPEMDGIEFIRSVRENDSYCFLPLLVMTTVGQTKRRDDALNAGADAFIQKPVTMEALDELLAEVW